MRILLLALSFQLILLTQVLAQSVESRIGAFLLAVKNIETEAELVKPLRESGLNQQGDALWRAALMFASNSEIEDELRRVLVTRLIHSALLADGETPEPGSIDRLSEADIAAMRRNVFFPDDGDLSLYLLKRGPSLRDVFEFEEYTILRLAPLAEFDHLFFERADRPYLTVGTDFSTWSVPVEDDIVAKKSGEFAKTRRLHLAAVPEIVLAAKAYRAAERTPSTSRTYAMLVASKSVDHALAAESRDFRPVSFAAALAVDTAFAGYTGNDPLLKKFARERDRWLAAKAFFARDFSEAAELYAAVTRDRAAPELLAWANWSEAISRFAAHEDAAPIFTRLFDPPGPTRDDIATIAALFLAFLPHDEVVRIGPVENWRQLVRVQLGYDPATTPVKLEIERDFTRIMHTIGRPDIAARFIAARIAQGAGAQKEAQYLRMLAPFLRDSFSSISFRMSGASGWVRRTTTGYPYRLDFLDSYHPEGRLVEPGEVVIAPDGTEPYTSLSPEEDLAIINTVFGRAVAETTLLPGVDHTDDPSSEPSVQALLGWARGSLNRENPSLTPMLKLIWLDWFSQAFEPLKKSPDPALFIYIPMKLAPDTEPQQVRALADHPAATPTQRELIAFFLEMHNFLDEYYSEND